MTEHLDRLASHVRSKLRVLGFTSPSRPILRTLLEIAYLASIKTEENQFVRGSLTYRNPEAPDPDPPLTRRADYPSFTEFDQQTPLAVDALVKLCRAVDRWSGSIAVYGTSSSKLFIWGVVDQLVGRNIRLNREATTGFSGPGVVAVSLDGVGDVSVYHGDLFLGRLRQNRLITRENEALGSEMVTHRVAPVLAPTARCIALALGDPQKTVAVLAHLLDEWANTVSRICIGLQRLGTGGSLLITSAPVTSMLDVVHALRYRRLGDSWILRVLDADYLSEVEDKWSTQTASGIVPSELAWELSFAEADDQDRADELTGAVKIVTSLAAADGVVLMDALLHVLGFGVKIRGGGRVIRAYDGPDFLRRGSEAKTIDLSHFGTRHGSMLRYCRADRKAIGLVVSQDGHTRLITSVRRNLTMWHDVKLLRHEDDVAGYARQSRRVRRFRAKSGEEVTLGYSRMPKTIRELLLYGGRRRPASAGEHRT